MARKVKSTMRAVLGRERKARGCIYCMYAKKDTSKTNRPTEANKSERTLACPYSRCPFRELDGLVNYIKEWDRKIEERMAGSFLGSGLTD